MYIVDLYYTCLDIMVFTSGLKQAYNLYLKLSLHDLSFSESLLHLFMKTRFLLTGCSEAEVDDDSTFLKSV